MRSHREEKFIQLTAVPSVRFAAKIRYRIAASQDDTYQPAFNGRQELGSGVNLVVLSCSVISSDQRWMPRTKCLSSRSIPTLQMPCQSSGNSNLSSSGDSVEGTITFAIANRSPQQGASSRTRTRHRSCKPGHLASNSKLCRYSSSDESIMIPSLHGRSDPSTFTTTVAPYVPMTVTVNEITSQPPGR